MSGNRQKQSSYNIHDLSNQLIVKSVNMDKHVDIMLEKNGFNLEDDTWHQLTSSISLVEAGFLRTLINTYNPTSTLEIGCAEGVSSMVICEAIDGENIHTILDPNQSGHWKNMGVNNLKKSGLNNYTLIEDYSEFVLPALLKEGRQFDFIFVDGWHTFDHVLLEFFYINRLLSIGGIVAFDDVALLPLNRVMRYISNYPNFEIVGAAGEFYESPKRKSLDKLKKVVNIITTPFGTKLKKEFLSDSVVRSSESLKINGSIAAFKKTANDERGWAWYESF